VLWFTGTDVKVCHASNELLDRQTTSELDEVPSVSSKDLRREIRDF
jgi:hypothetical protein